MTTADRIIGGQDAPSPIPWMVSVKRNPTGRSHKCGGTILDEMTVLSARHCFGTGSMNGYYVMAGDVDKSGASGQV